MPNESTGGSGPTSRAASAIARAIGCSEACSTAPTRRSASSRSTPSARTRSGERHLALGDGAGLVEDDRVHAAGGFEDLGPLDQDPELGAAAGADEKSGRGCQPERARASDDQDGNGRRQGERESGAAAVPVAERRHGDRDHDRDEDPRDAVGKPLDGRFPGLGLGHEPCDLSERGVGADAAGLDDEPAADVDGRPGDRVTDTDLDGNALSGQQRLVDGRSALDDDAVGRHLLARPDDETVADLELPDRNPSLAAVRVQDRRVLGTELDESPQRCSGGALRPRLEVAAGEQERDDHCRDLEVDLVASRAAGGDQLEGHLHPGDAGIEEEERDHRPAPGGERAQRDERVHRRCCVPQVLPGGGVERPARPEDDGGGELERQPLPVGELQRRDHAHQQHRERQDGGEDQPLP